MAFTEYTGDTTIIGALGTNPSERGLTTQEFKDKFDQFAHEFVAWFNATHLPEAAEKAVVDAHLAETASDTDGVHGLEYEEGNWTPTLYGLTVAGNNTYTTQTGKYVRINNKVTCYGYITLSAKDSAMEGNVKIGGLPFIAVTGRGSVSFSFISNLDFGTSELYLQGYPVNTRVDLSFVKDNTAPANLQPAAVQSTSSLMFVIDYFIG